MKTKLIFIGIIIISVFISFYTFKIYLKERKERIRIENNQDQLLSTNQNLMLNLKKKELQIVINQDSFLRVQKLMAKKINELIKAGIRFRIDTILKLEDRIIYISGDTIYKTIRESFYNDGWNIILNQIEGDSIRNNLIVQDSLYIINQWYRKWFLGKRHNQWELINRNPKVTYSIIYQIKKVK